MEQKTKFQYSYFIYPFVIGEEKYEKYLARLLKKPNCKLKTFEKEKDLDIYRFFLPQVRDYLFWSFGIPKGKMKELYDLPEETRAAILAKHPCNIITYELPEIVQGKTVDQDGIFFDIRKLEIICFQTGICFLVIKTTLNGEEVVLDDVLNFNYKFREIHSELSGLKQYENIKIQTGMFNTINEFTDLIKEIAGENTGAKDLNIDTERFITYAYACLGQDEWKEENKENLERNFYKLVQVLPANAQMNFGKKDEPKKEELNSMLFGFSKASTVLITSDKETDNYTKVPHIYESEYLYAYIFALYKKYYLKKLNYEFNTHHDFEKIKNKFLEFTQNVWVQEITNDEIGDNLCNHWEKKLGGKKAFSELKNKYDILYKDCNIEKTRKTIRIIAFLMAIIIGLLFLTLK